MAAATRSPTSFADATAAKQISSHQYSANFPDDWCIGTVPHGGFVTACFLQVAKAHFTTTLSAQNQPHPITLHLDFLRRTQSGPALFTVKDAKLGARTSIIHVSLSQDGREEVVGYITHSNMHTEEGVSFSTGWELEPAPPPVDFKALVENKDRHWAAGGKIPFAQFRKATMMTQFYFPRDGNKDPRFSDEWIRLATGEKWTNAALGYVADMWPMPVERFIGSADPYDANASEKTKARIARHWYPTLVLNLDFKKALPDEGVEWLFARVNVKQIKNGRMDLDIIIKDAEGDIVAISNHSALALDASRNTAQRGQGKSKI
ncbi:thioesterase-like superfamily-domain-containing protein [Xylogone sp. PMI_703]|nr:thioesterase-like superfamily-domain-containing protein [Xylogone sp. PMI_703]